MQLFFLHKPSKHAFILFCICRSAFEWNPLSSDSSNVWFVQMYIVHNILQFIFSFQEIRVELSVFWLQVLCIHYFISTTFSSLFFFLSLSYSSTYSYTYPRLHCNKFSYIYSNFIYGRNYFVTTQFKLVLQLTIGRV